MNPKKNEQSPLGVPSIRAAISTKELVALVRKERGRIRGSGRTGTPVQQK